MRKSPSPDKKQKLSSNRKRDISFEEDNEDDDGESINLKSPRSIDTNDFVSASEENDYFLEEDEEPEEDMSDEHTSISLAPVSALTSRLKATKISAVKKPNMKNFLSVSHPFILTKYQDASRRNWMVNIEVHLPSCSIQEDIEPALELRPDGHYLVLKEKMSADFSYFDFFERFLPDEMSAKDKSSLTLARQDVMMRSLS